MSSGALPQIPGLQSLLGRCQSLVRVHTCVRGLAETLCVLILCILVCGMADYLLVLPGSVRAGSLAIGVCLTLVVAWRRFLRPLMFSASNAELGAAVDLKFPELQESIATLISMERPDATASELGSAQMRNRIYQHVEMQVSAIRPTQVVPSGTTWHRFMMLAIAGAVLSLPFVIWPSSAQLLLQRLLTPFANLAAATNLYFDVPQGNRVVATGTDVTFIAIPQWRNGATGDVPTNVLLEMKTQDDRLEEMAMSWDESQRQFTASLVDARQTLQYRVVGGGASTEWFTMTVAEAPRIVAATLIETPPVYTGRPVRTIDGVVGDIHVFERSKIAVQLTFNKPVQPAQLTWKDWTPLPVPKVATQEEGVDLSAKELLPEELAAQAAGARMEGSKAAVEDVPVEPVVVMAPDRLSAAMEFDALGSGTFEFSVVDDVGLQNVETTPRRLISTLDTPPVLSVKGIADGLEVRPDDTVPLNCDVTDDIGVGALELHYRRNEEATLIEVADLQDRGATAVSHEFLLELASLNVKSGDRVELRVKAMDERPSPGPQVVWKGPWVLTISDNAEALGQKALREADKQLVEALRAMEKQLQDDAQQANTLKDEAWRNWNEDAKDKTRSLSEKEQTQGNDLQKLSQQVAQHPLMQKQADKLAELAQQIRQQLPKKLDEAVAAGDKEPAAKNLQETVNDLNRIRDELHRATDEIEKAASLEQELAELNRLALDADRLAKDTEQHQQKKTQNQPAEGQSKEELDKELQDERQKLQQDQQDLSQDLNSLLQRKQELLQAAREAQLDQAAKIAEQMQKLAQQQQQLAEGVNEEARDAAQDTQEIANQLQQARNEAEQLNRRMEQQAPEVARTEIPPLDEAIRDLRQGNLTKPEQQIASSAEQLERAAEELKKPAPEPPGPAPADDAAKAAAQREQEQRNAQRGEMQKKSEELADRMNKLEDQLEKANQERGVQESDAEKNPNGPANADSQTAEQGQEKRGAQPNGEQKSNATENPEKTPNGQQANPTGNQPNQQQPEQQQQGEQQANQQGNQQGDQPNPAAESERAAGELMNQLEKLAEAAREQSETLKEDAAAPNNVRHHAEQSAQRAEDALRHANAGQFQRSAERMRNAAGEASQAADQLNQEGQQDRKTQLQQQRDNFNRLADAFNRLQQDDAAQLSAQRSGQQQVAQQAAQTPDALSELSESLNNPSLGMQHLARPAQEAAEAAKQAAQSGQQAGQKLQQGQMQQAGQNAQEAAGQLNRAAQLAQQASQGHRDPNNLVPTEVGESVADAMQSLQRASEMMNQEASQPSPNLEQSPEGNGQPGNSGQQDPSGQPGQEGQGQRGQQGQPGQEGQPGQPGQGQQGQGQQGQGQPGQQGQGQGQGQQGQPGTGQQGQPGQGGNAQDGQGNQSAQQGEGGTPNGQPGSAQQMAKAAQALKQAAKGALPSQFSPGQLNSSADPSQGDPKGQGNPAEFDGQSPNATTRRGRARNWGRLQDELEPDVKDAGREVMDSEYSEIIRRYRRDLAKTGEANSDKKPAAKP